ncbi:MAG: YeeE/YedE family protein [Candidatus Eisenbacteria bacterium]|nr:YeeE/YedE family protein [Candidatus Eisenbacteria bacterium]
MLKQLHVRNRAQLLLGLLAGVVFGFLLQRGGVTRYEVIIGQLLLEDHTVARVMLAAVVVGSLGVHALRSLGLAELHPKPGSLGSSVVGGLIFGAGFAVLGYCPGTMAGAIGQGSMDALLGGLPGILLGAGALAALYPRLSRGIMAVGDFGDVTLPRLLKVNEWAVVLPACALIVLVLWLMRGAGV